MTEWTSWEDEEFGVTRDQADAARFPSLKAASDVVQAAYDIRFKKKRPTAP